MAHGRHTTIVAETAGDPRLSFGPAETPYSAYAHIDALHRLQEPSSGVSAEMSFIVTTQVMELLFGLLEHEWTQARQELRADDVPGAAAALRRGLHAQDVLVASWDLLATLTPVEFNAFRDRLGEASGFQSAAYRRLEFMIGNKSAAMLRPHAGVPEAHAELSAALRTPSLYDEVLALLHRRGLPIPQARLDRDWASPYEPHEDVETAWHTVYVSGAEHRDLVELAELLLDVAERITRWRQRHYASVKRAMGAKPGTAGSSGLGWLRRAVDQDVFPELWSARTGI
ncbi:tryptophan 2,3-dioxygenase [Actinomadura sp. HBU206391]|uniref:tryptophan 2,3-dioxygenase n=1 Tax=Actinomadura sp. HBU206391 TaxID=2731692 RepID=UPI0016502E45|nr:tryptophan 2,3-dioxygenase family protein [Actinomadura sp. HBU206391]MBC6462608.1 tryptophan 2,3-dioxygenase [Actinomadura sp. HBU206391]